MGYTTNDGRVRVDFFKASGKHYGTASVDMNEHYKGEIGECVRAACSAEYIKSKHGHPSEWGHTFDPRQWVNDGGTIVCLEPYHEHSFPIMIKQW
jgi:hypothetical protein